jgi:CubicO group peptidase (beta-lactamase class C family)
MIFRKIKLVIVVSLSCIFSLQAQTDNPKLDKFLLKKMKKSGRIGMQAAYIANGELAWIGSYGIKTYQTDDEVNDSTLFMTASISKPVTALAMMKLYDDGKVDLDDEINDYLRFSNEY